MTLDKYVYYMHDIYKNFIVRHNLFEHQFEQYYRGKGWMVNNDRYDVLSGDDPYYSAISKYMADEIVRQIEEGTEES